MTIKETIKNLPNNNRFYVLALSFLISIFVVCLLRLQVIDDQFYVIQVEQTFGFLSLAFLYITLAISPIKKIIGSSEWMKNLVFSRRALGVSALYFGLLHAGVSLWGQLGGFEGLTVLPDRFVWPLIWGALVLLMWSVMAITSFDKLVVFLTFPRWKWLQRLIYLSGILIILHVWAIGAHYNPGFVQNISFVALVILFGLESWRIAIFLSERYVWHKAKKIFTFILIWVVWVLLLLFIAFLRPAQAHMLLKDSVAGAGAILHITPDDDPVAGEQTSFVFDIQSALKTGEQSTAKLSITDEQQVHTSVAAKIKGTRVSAEYTFPRQGLYAITLSIEEKDKQSYQFMQSLRVSRGIINNVTVNSAPLWAEVGLLSTIVSVSAVLFIAFSRRKAIGIYSKL